MRVALSIALLAASPVGAADLVLGWPVDCTLGESCHIQQYVDRDPGPKAADHTCGSLAYDGHNGTDIRVADLAAMAAGTNVLAAAPGTVRGTRDAMPDRYVTPETRAQIAGQECGNGVVVDHGGGWQTQYCHLKLGSVQVSSGDRVSKGTVLGQIGLSGLTEFPHVEFLVRKDGQVIDPFDAEGPQACAEPDEPLWQDPPTYAPGGLLSVGISDAVPEFDTIKAGDADVTALPVTAPALVVWGYVFGSRAGDQLELRIVGPTGQEVHASTAALDRTQAQLFRAAGRRLRAAQWRGGEYTGVVSLIRAGQTIDTMETVISLN